ncbi:MULTISPECIES: hypothetical protein [unclassified Ruegeria]|uniref:hypothetical protein n=1 Tax=unclassified Ruegeria TaxID=2625375 RepID=UPI001487C4CC|nr:MULTISPECIES: hypothetical protein [unclassified Ruegeria]
MSFTKTKDRIFLAYETFSGWLARRSRPVRKLFYAVVGWVLRLIYVLPGNHVRYTAIALSAHVDHPSPRRLFKEYVRKLLLGFDRAERIRHGFGEEIDETLIVQDRERFERLFENGSFILVLPHAHGAIPMARCLSNSYPILSIVRVSKDKNRAEAQHRLYHSVGCEFVDVREADPTFVARIILRTLKRDGIVVAMVDRIDEPPTQVLSPARDLAAVSAFGEIVGVQTWPARYAQKAGVPILAATVVQTETELHLVLGQSVMAGGDLVSTTQNWVSELEHLLRQYPQEWIFWLDKHWSRVLRRNPPVSRKL